MSDQTPDLAALEALAEAASAPPWVAEYSLPTGDCVIQEDAQSTMEAIALCTGYRSGLDAAFIAAAHPGTVLWLIREVERLRESIAGSPDRAQRLASLVASSTRLVQIERDDARARAEKAEATIERVRELADRVESRMMATAKPDEIRAALDGGEPDA